MLASAAVSRCICARVAMPPSSQFADFTSGAPEPDVATASLAPSANVMNRIVCCIEREHHTRGGAVATGEW